MWPDPMGWGALGLDLQFRASSILRCRGLAFFAWVHRSSIRADPGLEMQGEPMIQFSRGQFFREGGI